MKEFSAQTGGRYTYVDDINNLQELVLAYSQVFKDCDNFVISGCEVSGDRINPGFVYLNGKIRVFSGASGISAWPQYIYESNKVENVAYASGTDKVGRNIYGCMSGPSVPKSLDPITGKAASALTIQQTGGITMKDAFFGKYALLLDAAVNAQTVKGKVSFTGDTFLNSATAKSCSVKSGNDTLQVQYEGHNLTIQSQAASGTVYKFVIADGVGTQLYVNEEKIATFGRTEIQFHVPLSANKGIVGGIAIQLQNIFNHSSADNEGTLNINMLGYNGGTTHYRNTVIGNGRGAAIISVNGSANTVTVNGVSTFVNDSIEGLVLKSTLRKSQMILTKAVVWKDSDNSVLGQIGFVSVADQSFDIDNKIGNVNIGGLEFVDLGPSIKEGGVLLSAKYVLVNTYKQDMAKKANESNVYSTSLADATFAAKKNGFSQFIVGSNTQEQLRKQIGALGASDGDKFAAKSKLLADMIRNEDDKRNLRNNIGAAGVGDFQAKLKDTGWSNFSGSLHIRQIGNIVSVQGKLKTVHEGTVFTIPNDIDPPAYAVYQSVTISNKHNWSVCIPANSRKCVVKYCNGSCGETTEFSITYMV